MRVSVCKSVSSEFVVCLAINEIRRIGYFFMDRPLRVCN